MLAACGPQEEPVTYSELRGTFKNEEYNVSKTYKKTTQDDEQYLFAMSYPFFLLDDNTQFYYSSEQKLSLKKDFTYRYEYNISLSNSGYQEIARIEVDMSGTFTYELLNDDLQTYYVSLSNPYAGKESIYSPLVVGTSNPIYWSVHESPDVVIDIAECVNDPYFAYDKYIQTRKVIVTKKIAETDFNKVEDRLFNNFIIDDLCKYCTQASTR